MISETLARDNDHDTSEEAAERVSKSLKELQGKVYTILAASQGLTDSELRERCNAIYGKRQESTYRKRRSELVALGLVQETGEKRLNPAGNWEKVFAVIKGAKVPTSTPIKKLSPEVARLQELICEVLHHDTATPCLPDPLRHRLLMAISGTPNGT